VINFAFDPTKSPCYKVVHVGSVKDDHEIDYFRRIQTYSSETGVWSVSDDRFNHLWFNDFGNGIYWNGAIHWLNIHEPFHVKLDIVDHLVLKNIQIPLPLTVKGQVHRDHKLSKSHVSLLLLWLDSGFNGGFECCSSGSDGDGGEESEGSNGSNLATVSKKEESGSSGEGGTEKPVSVLSKEKFSFESDHSEDNIKAWIMNDMSSKWKCWKYELKKSSYDPTMKIDEIVASQTDDRVETGQFRTLVEITEYSGAGNIITSLTVTQEECVLAGTKDGSLLVYSIENPQLRRISGSRSMKSKATGT
ncbi:hypothetical protein Tco_1454958, partial [Tanacetum coccineum]